MAASKKIKNLPETGKRVGALYAIGFASLLWLLGIGAPIERSIWDWRLGFRGTEVSECPFAVVLFDTKSYEKWPEPTMLWGHRYAEVSRNIRLFGPKAIVWDFVHSADVDRFVPELSPNAAFGLALLEWPEGMILAYKLGNGNSVLPSPEFTLDPLIANSLAYIDLPESEDGTQRYGSRYRQTERGLAKSLAFAGSIRAGGLSNASQSQMFLGDLSRWKIPVLSAVDIQAKGELLRDRVVFVGFADPNEAELKYLPVLGYRWGAEVQARLAATLWAGSEIRVLPVSGEIALGILVCLAAYWSSLRGYKVVLAGSACWFLGSMGLILTAIALPIAPVMTVMFAALIGSTIGAAAGESMLRRAIQRAFICQVGSETVNFLLESSNDDDIGAARLVTGTVLFLDIRKSTLVGSEKSPGDLLAWLNDFFESAVPLVAKHGGAVLSFAGDGFMAVFGAFEAHPNDAVSAIKCTQEILTLENRTGPEFGIGLNHGEFVIGNLGSSDRLQFSAIGDVVNIASRIEGLTTDLQANALVSESVALLAIDLVDKTKYIRSIKNHPEPITIFKVLDNGSSKLATSEI